MNVEDDLKYGSQGFCGKKLNGGTTVAGTMALAHGASIKVFATGGLGGVHRGASNSMDVSADLVELERTPVTVVSSGCKSFLDIPKTLEFLETQGVTVGTFADGRDGNIDFPAFWTRDSGIRSPMVLQNEEEAAAMMCELYTIPVLLLLDHCRVSHLYELIVVFKSILFPLPSLVQDQIGCLSLRRKGLFL